MLEEDPEVMLAIWRNIFIKLLGFLALVLMVGILFNLVLALLVLTVEADKKSGGNRDQKDTDEGGDNEAQGSGREIN